MSCAISRTTTPERGLRRPAFERSPKARTPTPTGSSRWWIWRTGWSDSRFNLGGVPAGPMKIGILVSHPTQFETPFFRYASEHKAHSLMVIYWQERHTRASHDPAVNRVIAWRLARWDG